jgi:hypothetical protein
MTTTQRLIAVAGLALVGISGCGPVKQERLVQIESNHTAFRLPLEDANDGKAFMSVEYLKAKRVPMQRYAVPQRARNTGRLWWEYEWIPTELIVVVDRAPVTRNWTDANAKSGPNAIRLESLESVGYTIGITITASIEEEDAPLYLYNFGGYTFNEKSEKVPYTPPGGEPSDPSLGHLLDTVLRGWIQQKLSHDLGNIALKDTDAKLGSAIDACFLECRKVFKQQGITIQSLGLAAGLRFENAEIQRVIDLRYTAATDIEVAKKEAAGQRQLNERMLAKVRTEIDTANKRVAAKEAVLLQVELRLRMLDAETFKLAAEGWDGKPAHLVPQGAQFLFGLDGGNQPFQLTDPKALGLPQTVKGSEKK